MAQEQETQPEAVPLDAIPVVGRTPSEDLTRKMFMIDHTETKLDGPPPIPWPPPFESFKKIARLNREICVTEKLDGTNALVWVPEDPALPLMVGSRNRWITPGKGTDNYDFARWVMENEPAIRRLGPGKHFGEWWGVGIARRYGLSERRWSLFTHTWTEEELRARGLPANVHVVPKLYTGVWEPLDKDIDGVLHAIAWLAEHGSAAAPGFKAPEGIVIFHRATGTLMKWTFDGDGNGKEPSPIE